MENLNGENILIKNMLNDKVFFNKLISVIKPEYMNTAAGENIVKIIKNYYNKYGSKPTVEEVLIEAQNIPLKELRSEIATKFIEMKNTPSEFNGDFLDDFAVKYIKDQLFIKALVVGADFVDKKNDSSKIKARELMEEANNISLAQDMGDSYDNIDERIEYYKNPQKGIKFKRFEELNKRIGDGFLKGTLNIFLAPAGVGKSLLMSTSITDFLSQGYNILLVSMEMNNMEFMKRIDADLLDLPINDFKVIDSEIIKNKFNEKNIGKLYVQNYPAGTFSASNLNALLDMYKQHDITFDAVFLDYLGLMKSDRVNPSAGLYSYIKSIGEEVRAQANIWQLPIFSASQLGRCFSLSKSKIMTTNGGKTYDELNEFDKIFGKNNNIVRLIKKVKTGVNKCYCIKTKKGKNIFVSADHRIPTNNGLKTIRFGLKPGDKVNTK